MDRSEEFSDGDIEAHAQYDWSTTSPSDAVVDTVASVVSGGPTSFGPLYDRIDPDALDSLVQSTGTGRTADGIRVSFSLADRLVTVHSNGEVVVRTPTRKGAEKRREERSEE
ncbi:hypothetical protein GJ633_01835 [Halorubrum sp. CBA1125]|uniref:HalOD1 output domain-containing protein n=1 Tax=Halorubrum sp. CBA1125 TaxID=2668072 RepID=UPI0012E8E4EA|nr:HalOD1 output domain-containing protein [Halorubrum sp. CBA1125]MUW13526.1 hypothetical protein [Halorubrum sp. CBA1125]